MIILVLVVAGLALGSFVNALVFRLHEKQQLADSGKQSAKTHKSKKQSANSQQLTAKDLSILKGRSVCPHCHHVLAPKDLVPVFSWLWLGGKCRYCGKPIDDSPVIELAVPALFVVSYLFWPMALAGESLFTFVLWLVFLVGFVALALYDLKWFLLPDKIVFPLIGLTVFQVLAVALVFEPFWPTVIGASVGAAVLSGLFWGLFTVSKGKWIGFGDVKLAIILGLLAGGAFEAMLLLFAASVLGMFVALPLLASGKAGRKSHIPFGPFLLAGAVVVQLFGVDILDWYTGLLAVGA